MKPSRPCPPHVPRPPGVEPARRTFVVPEGRALRDLRLVLARGGVPPSGQRTAEQDARLVAFRAVQELLRFFEQCRRRIEAGEPCRLVERPHPHEAGRLLVEFVIEVQR